MAQAALPLFPWLITGARPVALPRIPWTTRASGARTVRMRTGYALFSEVGRYVGMVTAPAGTLRFGAGAGAVLLRREY